MPDKPKSDSSFKRPLSLTRLTGYGTSGYEGATIGFVLVGCVAVGFLLGNWADKHFGTQIWMPVGVLLGVAAGFREMFLTLKRITLRAEEAKAKAPKAPAWERPTTEAEAQAPTERRSSIFEVPAPPFEKLDSGKATISPNQGAKEDSKEDSDHLIEQLLRGELDADDIEALPPDIRKRLGLDRESDDSNSSTSA